MQLALIINITIANSITNVRVWGFNVWNLQLKAENLHRTFHINNDSPNHFSSLIGQKLLSELLKNTLWIIYGIRNFHCINVLLEVWHEHMDKNINHFGPC